MKRPRLVAGFAMMTFVLGACTVTKENQNVCKGTWAVLGAAVGGSAVGVPVANSHDPSDAEVAGAAAGGAIAGGLLGLLAGHYICEVNEVPLPAPMAPPPPPPPSGRIETLTGPSFDFDKSALTAEGRTHVEHAAQIMRENPTLHVVVEGHTDSIGSHAYNMKLSQRRADTVRTYLVQRGIAASRIETAAYGETHPVASNAIEEGRAQNRRVEIVAH